LDKTYEAIPNYAWSVKTLDCPQVKIFVTDARLVS
jgi:hypothetical protein